MNEEMRNAMCGAASGITSAVLVCPLDVVKVRLQNSGSQYSGTFRTLGQIVREEGAKRLFSGLSPTKIPKTHTSVQASAVVVASFLSDIITTPFWVVRTRLMTQTPTTLYYYDSISDAFATMYRKEGLKSFYKGLLPSLVGIVHPAIQFPLYEHIKQWFQEYHRRKEPSIQAADHLSHMEIIVASAISKMAASIITYPHEVIRTRLQTQTTVIPLPFTRKVPSEHKGILSISRYLIQQGGVLAFYKGLGTNLLRTVPSTAVSLWMYEFLKRDLQVFVLPSKQL